MRKHVAGVVPVSGLRDDFNMPWHSSLMPISPNYLAVERSIAECAYAGCDSVWVVCSDDVTPLIRHQVGEKIQDPVYNYRHFEFDKNAHQKPIRIYYVPLAVKDINKRDNLAWSAIHGAKTSDKILGSLSKHVRPEKFYISWPYGYCDPEIPREHRRDIDMRHVVFAHNNSTVKENKYLSLTLDINQINELINESVTTSTGLWDETRKNRLSLEDRYSYKRYDLKKVFANLDFSKYKVIEVDDYHSIYSWKRYCDFISENKNLKKPKILKYSEWNEIGLDDT